MATTHKAMAIPVIQTASGGLKFLIVLDKRFKEWTFVTGGCRRREVFNPIRCALRELEEETRGVINLKKGTYSYFKFSKTFEPTEETLYHVYIFYLHMTPGDMEKIKQKFMDEKRLMDNNQVCFRKNYDENDSLEFMTIDEIKKIENLWPLINDKILQNSAFYEALDSPKSDNFYMVY